MRRSLLTPDGVAARGGHFSHRRVIESAGGRLQDVAKTSLFLIWPSGTRAATSGSASREAPPADRPRVVSSLARPDLLVEVEAIVPLP